MASGHGGPREGAGRKKTRERFESEVATTEAAIAGFLPQAVKNLIKLANGGYKRKEQKFERVAVRDAKGKPKLDDNEEQVYEFVLVEEKVSIAEPDRTANIALVERILGKPAQSVDLEGEDGEGGMFAIVRVPIKETLSEWTKAAEQLQEAQKAANQKPPESSA